MKANTLCFSFLSIAALAACGPSARDDDAGGDTGADSTDQSTVDASDPGVCNPTAEVCSDGLDNDCDGQLDCEDSDCSGIGSCPVCGEVEAPEASPLVLPDGEPNEDIPCTTDANCASAAGTKCVAKLCRVPYVSTLNFIGFPDGATLDDPSKLIEVCANMEHSWARDLQIELIAPNGTVGILHNFVYPRDGGEVDLGNPDPDDDGQPGVGADYCWKVDASKTMIEYANQSLSSGDELPPGDYKDVTPYSAFVGTPLNGPWSFRITDLWRFDDGFLFSWTIKFDPSLVADCSGPIIGKTAPTPGQ